MEIEDILKKFFELLKESNQSSFKKKTKDFEDVLNLSTNDFISIIQNLISPVPKTEEKEPFGGINGNSFENDTTEVQNGYEESEEDPIVEGSQEPFKHQGKTSRSPPRRRRKKSPGGKRIPPDINPTVSPQPLPLGRTSKIKIDPGETIKTVERTVKKFTKKLDDSLIESERELKDHYSVSGSIAGIPCQMCRYYCRNCEMGESVMDGFDCTATCNMQYYNLRGYLSCSKYSLWPLNDFEEREFTEIPGNFFRGFMLILCHNHHKAFKQKTYELTKHIREQMYEKAIIDNYEEDLGSFVTIRLDNLLEKGDKSVPIGIYISRQHLDHFKETYKLMKKKRNSNV